MNIFPEFYNRFTCKADRCEHTCCQGWEIDVDDETAFFYLNDEEELGKRLATSLYRDEEGYHFRLVEERCPFLREDGLCEIILGYGEDALCDVCALHPRFFFEAFGAEFAGLGASCERVCELIMESKGRLLFETDGGEELTLDGVLARILPSDDAGAQHREDSPGEGRLPEQIETRSYRPDMSPGRTVALLKKFEATEPIDDEWPREIRALHKTNEAPQVRQAELPVLQNIFDYIFYRQIERLPDAGLVAIESFARDCTDFIVILNTAYNDLAKSFRRFSEQIEYSTVNVEVVMQGSVSGE